MIDWFYSDPRIVGFYTGVTRDHQNFVEGTKTIVGTSNRSTVVGDVVCDDFIHLRWRADVKQVPSRLMWPPTSIRVHRRDHPAELWTHPKSATSDSRLHVHD